jgi:hypothetical protein
MKSLRIVVTLALMACLSGVAYVAQQIEPAGTKMADAADKFLASLKPEQKAKATFDFDNTERTNFWFVPREDKQKRSIRKGLPLEDMTQDQQTAARELLRASTSASGYLKATTIMSLESILRELEKTGPVRNPQWYFFTIFGKPSKSGKWGWRVEGHHLSLNFTLENGKVVSATPAFFGANPAKVKAGPRQGLETLPEAEHLAINLFKSLDDDQRKIALRDKAFPEIEQANIVPGVGAPQGLQAEKMNEKQRALLQQLIESYADRMPQEVRAAELEQVRQGGLNKVYFAFTGGTQAGEPHTYRVQGPTFVIEFINVQADSAGNKANHIHSAWRNLQGDFGLVQK